jgi:hypothetical protein
MHLTNNMKLNQKISTQVSLLATQIIIVVIILYIIYAANFDSSVFIYVIIPMFIVLVLPTAYIHYDYYIHGRNYSYEINDRGIIQFKNDKFVTFDRANFKEIKLYMSGTRLIGSGVKNFPFEDYYYAKITTIEGDEILISCLFSKKIDELLVSLYSEVPVTKNKYFYPLIQNK